MEISEVDCPAQSQLQASSPCRWLRDHAGTALLGIVVGGVVLRLLLAWGCPQPYGYVYDYYYKVIEVMWTHHRLPVAADGGECWQPPLFFLSGLPFFAAGRVLRRLLPVASDIDIRALMLVPFVSGMACVWYSYRILRIFRLQPEWNVLGLGFLMVLPVLFFSTYGFESDVFLGAIMLALLYYTLRYGYGDRVPDSWVAIRMGALAGLAAATKYSGLIGVALIAIVIGEHTLRHFRVAAAWRNLVLAAAVCSAIGSWKYVDNFNRYGTAMYSLVGAQHYGNALGGIGTDKPSNPIKPYDFSSFHLRSLIRLVKENSAPGRLTDWWAYRSFWTTMYGLTWNDLGMFSRPTRHGDPSSPYPLKHIPVSLQAAVFLLGLEPTLLSIVGLLAVGYRRVARPLVILSVLTAVAYVHWAVSQPDWGMKPKYLLFLVAPFCVFAIYGLKVISARAPRQVATLLLTAWMAMVATTAVYLAWFSVA